MKRFATIILLVFCLTAACRACAESAGWADLYALSVENAIEYGDLREEWAQQPDIYKPAPQGAEIPLLPQDAALSGDIVLETGFDSYPGLYSGENETPEYVLVSGDNECAAVWRINVAQPGLYELKVSYLALGGNEIKAQRKITIDGETPFDEANNLCFYRAFEEEIQPNGKMRLNAINDEVWPHMIEKRVWQTVRAVDQQAIYVDPLQFYLSAGEHEIKLEYVDQPVVLGNIAFISPIEYPAYQEKLAEWQAAGYKNVSADTVIKLQAEDSAWRSENVIRRESDADPLTEPKSGANRVLNIVGGYRWRLGNAAVTWEIDVPESGLYALHLKVLQSTDPGMPSFREFRIDGEIPFEEMKLYSFPYSSTWYGDTLRQPDGTPYSFYLEQGKHYLTATVKLGPIGEIMRRTEKDTTYLGRVQREIVKITGTEPDYNYEYDLYRTMPELSGQLTYLAGRLQESADLLASISSETTSMENNFRQIIDQLHFFSEDVDRIPKALSDLDNAQTNLGTYISTIEKCPMAMDYLMLSSPDVSMEIATSNFLQRMAVTGENFLASFTKDYDSVGLIVDASDSSMKETTVLNVWIARGTEWGEILKELADEEFTPKTGIVINLHVLPTGQLSTGSVNTIMLSVASGTAPDVALSVEYNLPNEFAFREAVCDLSQFPGFEEIVQNFYPSSLVPFQYNGGVYALPETMDFTCMIYRRDVLAELGVELPETWEDLYQKVLPRLYENNMSFSLPVDTSVSSNSPGALRGFTMLLLQMGGAYYRGEGEASGLDSPEAYKAFKAWTDMYANYEIDAESNFFTRIRTGTMPIGIGNFTTYMQLMTSAPELYGRWSIAPVPGTRQADGTVKHTVGTTAATADIILSQSEKKEAAWKFLKWWGSEETQTRYGRELEAILGMGARWNTANVNAFYSLPWDARHERVIRAQMDAAEEQMIVPGGYFTGRHIINAWNRVVINNENVRDALEKAVKDINKELHNKRVEFGLE
ncbi:MAG: extracellular solute-binding protein [Clostridia bacterium]|nr:extracellular solute-binding protein [Clostridia bacterium]